MQLNYIITEAAISDMLVNKRACLCVGRVHLLQDRSVRLPNRSLSLSQADSHSEHAPPPPPPYLTNHHSGILAVRFLSRPCDKRSVMKQWEQSDAVEVRKELGAVKDKPLPNCEGGGGRGKERLHYDCVQKLGGGGTTQWGFGLSPDWNLWQIDQMSCLPSGFFSWH